MKKKYRWIEIWFDCFSQKFSTSFPLILLWEKISICTFPFNRYTHHFQFIYKVKIILNSFQFPILCCMSVEFASCRYHKWTKYFIFPIDVELYRPPQYFIYWLLYYKLFDTYRLGISLFADVILLFFLILFFLSLSLLFVALFILLFI